MIPSLDANAYRSLGCTSDVIEIVRQAPLRNATRSLVLDQQGSIAILCWSLLRWEKKVAQVALVHLRVDLLALERDLDLYLDRLPKESILANPAHGRADGFSSCVIQLLHRAAQESRIMNHSWLGTEHLLLALVVEASNGLASLLQSHGIAHASLREATLKVLQ
jgi:ATP-dependent Clp protease ATP-binding subunit ClpA